MIGSRSCLILFAALAVGCTKTSVPHSEGRPVRSDQVIDFATLYGRNCAGCHGADGQFGPAPPLNDPLFLAIVPDAVLWHMVSEGRPGTPMPAFSREKGGSLTDEQIKIIAEGIKSRWKAKRPEEPPPEYLVSGNQKAGDAGRGLKVFERACASCHGKEGLGGADKVGPINDPAFLALISDQAVRRFIITGRHDLKMPNFAGKSGRPSDFRPLSPTDVADLVELVSGWRRNPREPRRTP